MNYSEKIKKLRKENNLTQSELAEKLFVTRQAVSLWEKGKVEPSKDSLILIKELFGISVDEWLENNTKIKKTKDIKKIICFTILLLLIVIIIIGIINIITRSAILKPKGYQTVEIIRKDPIKIKFENSETIVFEETEKPIIKCNIPAHFIKESNQKGTYKSNESFIKFNSDFESNVYNPLLNTNYCNIYKQRGYETYMDMIRKAMYMDLNKINAFSKKDNLFLAGGAKILRNQLCAGINAEYYEIDGGLSNNHQGIYGFALHFSDNIWLITLKNENKYCYITIKDPDEIGKSIESVTQFISTINIFDI